MKSAKPKSTTPRQRFRFACHYVGEPFSGFQTQPGRTTVQSRLEDALLKITGEAVRVMPSGRTDTGVNALEQICHVDFASEQAVRRVTAKTFEHQLNSLLKNNIAITRWRRAGEFHARMHATGKVYEYHILLGRRHNPFLEDRVWRLPHDLDVAAMKKAAAILTGRHDFSSFCATDSSVEEKTRTLNEIKILNRHPLPFYRLPDERFLRLRFTGEGFLKQMVRNLVGTLVDVGLGKRTPTEVRDILQSRDRKRAGRTAPACGLYLVHVKYGARSNKTRSLPSDS